MNQLNAGRRAIRFVGSSKFATTLLAIIGVLSMAASVIPQGPLTSAPVATWAAAHPRFEAFARAAGLHQAFSNPLFVALAIALGFSTAICAWERTKVALHRAKLLGDASRIESDAVARRHDFEILLGEGVTDEPLSVASGVLTHLGVKHERHGGVLRAVSPRWTVYGSPIFHWALLGLLVTILIGSTLRAEGLLGIAVGDTKPDVPSSYGTYKAGLLYNAIRMKRSVRVDSLELDYNTGGVDRGPTPSVSVLDGTGAIIKSQRVYPNHTLKTGALTIYPSAYGLTAVVSVVDTRGVTLGKVPVLIDFSDTAPQGTVAIGGVKALDPAGQPTYRAIVTVPLDRGESSWLKRIPDSRSARFVVTTADGQPVADKVVREGESLTLPGGSSLVLDGISYYARLKVVDDWTVPLLYAWLVVAGIGLSIASLAGQQTIALAVAQTPDGPALVGRVRIWRNSATTGNEIERELTTAFHPDGGGTS